MKDPFGPSRSLARGALVFRWIALAWMTVLALTSLDHFRRPALAWISIGVAGAWTIRITTDRDPRERTKTRRLVIDILISSALIAVSGLVVEHGAVVNGEPFFASAYPVAAVIAWAIEFGPSGGAAAGAWLGLFLIASRPINSVPIAELRREEVQSLATGILLYVVTGLSVGLVAKLLDRSGEEVRVATMEAMREHGRAARLAERESMARQIHDSVLQALALVHKRGRELATTSRVDRRAVGALADLAAEQEEALRVLIMRDHVEAPTGSMSLRDELESMARSTDGLRVEVSTVGPVLLEAKAGHELVAAVRQAIQNVVNHAATSRAVVFAEIDEGWLSIAVRDDGIGFDFDPASLQARGKAGLLKSVIGRVEDLGGSVRVTSAHGDGTLIEMRVPVSRD